MPYHVQVHIYRRPVNGATEYAMFERSDYANVWQGVCGGGEEGESIAQTALRETGEEGGITTPGPLYALNSTSWMRLANIKDYEGLWDPKLIVMPMYYFGMPHEGPIILSEEHTQYRWVGFEEALSLLYFSEHKTALYELDARISLGTIHRSLPAWMQVEHNIDSYINFLGS